MKHIVKIFIINIILIVLLVFLFEKFFLIEYLNKYTNAPNNLSTIRTPSDIYKKKECKAPLKYSFVDTRGPGLLRDEKVGHFLTPNFNPVNNNGFLFDCYEKKNKNDFNIILIGDSFTASLQIPVSKTWPNLLRTIFEEKKKGKTVNIYNLAVGGAGMIHQIEQLNYAIDKMKPDLVIHSIFLGNDFTDEDFETFQIIQKPHRQFPPSKFKVISDATILSIKPRLNYYLIMNLVNAFNNTGTVLENDLGKFVLDADWLWNDSPDLEKRFKLKLKYKEKTYNVKKIKVNPIRSYLADDIAIIFEFQIRKETLSIQILRSQNYIANHNKIIFARSCFLRKKICSKITHFFNPENVSNVNYSYNIQHSDVMKSIKQKSNNKKNEKVSKDTVIDNRYKYPFEATIDLILKLQKIPINNSLENITLEKKYPDAINDMPRPYMIYVDDYNKYMHDRKRIFQDSLKEIKKITNSQNYFLFTIPSMLSASKNYWDYANLDELSSFKISRYKPEEIAKEVFKNNRIIFKSFFEFIENNKINASTLYDPFHRHFTVKGHSAYLSFIINNIND
tara:strand:- start:9418 stop:11103 length:1686 start_codon:yes stop_codon:yes gene_type:complete